MAAVPIHDPSGDPGIAVRVMLVDDSAVIRRVVSNVLADEAGIEVVGTATNGQEALDRIDAFAPDLVVLDVEMPVLDGLATIRKIRPRWPVLPVIMFSTLTSKAASATIDALSHGANDYATKPSSLGITETIAEVRSNLVPLIRSWGAIGQRRRRPGATPPPARPGTGAPTSGTSFGTSPLTGLRPSTLGTSAATPRPAGGLGADAARRGPARIDALVIGSSAGGPNALAELIPQFPANFPVPVLLTQHMPETFTALLASRLNDQSALTVVESEPGMEILPGHLYLAKGGKHQVVARRGGKAYIEHDDGPPECYCKPAVDVMFRSAAKAWGANLLAVVLTGMGRDGTVGAKAIVDAGGSVITQNEETCLVWGMPGAVYDAGLSSENLPLDRIYAAVANRLAKAVAR